MIIRDIKGQFFESLDGRILILCALDVDAICACRILQFLLESHNLQYSVAPVASIDNLCKIFEEYRTSVDSIVMVNFGNRINILKLLKPADTLTFYLIDSHRPIDVNNYYVNRQVKLFINKNEDRLNIPPRDKLFRMNSEGKLDDGDDEENLALLSADARELSNEQLERRRRLRKWITKRQDLMFDYEEFSYCNRAASLIMYDLAHLQSRDNNYLLWLCIVGLTHQLQSDKIDELNFKKESERLDRHIARHQFSSNQAKGNTWQIELIEDLNLHLYRNWTLYESFSHTPLTVCSFQLWSDSGIRNLYEFLVECGMKLGESQQVYNAMDLRYRHNLIANVAEVCLGSLQDKYSLQSLITKSFVMSRGFKDKFSACDVALAVRALLDSSDPLLCQTEKFVRAIRSLSHDDFELLKSGFTEAMTQLKNMSEQVKHLIKTAKVTDVGVLLQADLTDQDNSAQLYARGESIISFARFLLQAYVDSKPYRVRRRVGTLPLVLVCPEYSNDELVLIVGIPPCAQQTKKNFFAKAFEQTAKNLACELKSDLSEPNLIRINVNLKNQFLEHLKPIVAD